MTSIKARSAGLGAVATFAGFAASLGAAHADADQPQFHSGDKAGTESCTIGRDGVEYRVHTENGASGEG